MDYSSRLSISYYKVIAAINEPHKIYLVHHPETGKVYIKKILDIYNIAVYNQLKNAEISGIPKLIDYCEIDGSLILIEEFIPGDSLAAIMKCHSLTPERITNCILSLCATIETLHSLQPPVIHRDIKPANILMDRNQNPILIDFNAAKNLKDSSACDTVLLGTQGYAAPEQYGFGSSTPQTDIYSLGILLREMVLSLETPTTMFDSIIQRCTQMDPQNRYASAAELKAAMGALNQTNIPAKSTLPKKHFLPPGYRTGTPWKIVLASLGYLLILWISFSLEVKNSFGAMLWVERVSCFAMLLSIVLGSTNYCNIQRCFPLCKKSNKIVHYAGVVLLDAALSFTILTIMVIIESIFFTS